MASFNVIPLRIANLYETCVNTLVYHKVTMYRLFLFRLFRFPECGSELCQAIQAAFYPSSHYAFKSFYSMYCSFFR